MLRSLPKLREEGAELLYSQLLLPELAAKIVKRDEGHELCRHLQQVSEALTALLLEGDVGLIQPRAEHLETAMTLKALGHPEAFKLHTLCHRAPRGSPASNQGQEAAPPPRGERPRHKLRAGTATN